MVRLPSQWALTLFVMTVLFMYLVGCGLARVITEVGLGNPGTWASAP
jgi:hypothetical protein